MSDRIILAIDPGPTRSAWVSLFDGRPHEFGIEENAELIAGLRQQRWSPGLDVVVIEKVEGFGMAVGVEVFETVFWTGRFAEAVGPIRVVRLGRKAVKVHLCGTTKAKDPNIRAALLDRYGGETVAKGTKAAPGPLRGISKDVWAALAVAVTHYDGVAA